MPQLIKRRQFLQATLAASASIGISSFRSDAFSGEEYVEALVIGSGFGGAVASLRLGQVGIETIVLERGRRWPITAAGNTFCTHENPDGRSTWLSPKAFFNQAPIDIYTGVFDVKIGNGIAAARGAGVGGGSLIYGGITYQPIKELFYKVFPRTINYEELHRVYYPRVRSILNVSPIPDDILQTPYYLLSRTFRDLAIKAGFNPRSIDIAFDWDIVRQEISGQKVASAITGQLYYGVNSGAKNSLDRNYLSMAEATGYVEIRPLHVVTSIEEYNGRRYRVVCNQINEHGVVLAQKSFCCHYLFLAAGSIGTTELLLRAKANSTLPRLNNYVGKFWGTNSDSNTAILTTGQTNPTQGSPPGLFAIEHFNNPIAPLILESLPLPFLPSGLVASLGQAISKPEGYLTYNSSTQSADLFWPANSANNQKNAQAFEYTYQLLNSANSTTLAGPSDFSQTAHPLGGAILEKVCSNYGEVDGYRNLFVVDSALIPGSTGCVNPSLTIAALAERCMDRFLNRIPKHSIWNR